MLPELKAFFATLANFDHLRRAQVEQVSLGNEAHQTRVMTGRHPPHELQGDGCGHMKQGQVVALLHVQQNITVEVGDHPGK